MDVERRGLRLNVEEHGSGPTVLLVSGHLQAAEDWRRFGYLDLLDGFRVLAVDPLGYGRSDKPHDPAPYELGEQADDLAAVLDAAGVGSAAVWGYSRGAILAEALARCHPDRVDALLTGGMLPGLSADERRGIFAGMADGHRELEWPDFFDQQMSFILPVDRDLIAARNDRLACAAAWEGTFTPHRAEGGPLPVPAAAYLGDGEWFWEAVRDWAGANDAEFTLVEGRDHGATFRDADAVVPLVEPFLRRHAA